MLKRLFAVTFAVALVATAGSLLPADEKGSKHNGEVVGVDREAKTITIKVKDGDQKETNVYHVTAKTVFLDKDDSPTTLDKIQAGMKVQFRSIHKEKQKQLLELEIRPDKE